MNDNPELNEESPNLEEFNKDDSKNEMQENKKKKKKKNKAQKDPSNENLIGESNENDIAQKEEDKKNQNAQSKDKSDQKNENLQNNKATEQVKKDNTIEEKFNIEKLGLIKFAKEHQMANRPLEKKADFTADTDFCKCCNLPVEKKGILEEFNFCSDTDEFNECGQGIVLYFYFFRFSIFIMLAITLIVAIPTVFLTEGYTQGIINVCNQYYDLNQNVSDELQKCNRFITHASGSEYYDGQTDWTGRHNMENLKVYRNISKVMSGDDSNALDVTVNFSFMNFICLITLFIINLIYIGEMRNKNKETNMTNTSPSDYTLVINNMDKVFKVFLEENSKDKTVDNEKEGKNEDQKEAGKEDNKEENKGESGASKKGGKKKKKKKGDKNESNNNVDDNVLIIEEPDNKDEPKENNDINSGNAAGNDEKNQKNDDTKNKVNNTETKKASTVPKEEETLLTKFEDFIKKRVIIDKLENPKQVDSINVCFKMDQFLELEEQIQEIKSKISQIKYSPHICTRNQEKNYNGKDRHFFSFPLSAYGITCVNFDSGETIEQLKEKKEELEKKVSEQLELSKNLNESNFGGSCFVTFDTIKEKEEFYALYPHTFLQILIKLIKSSGYVLCGCCIDKKKMDKYKFYKHLEVHLAPEPDDIIWENMEFSFVQRVLRASLMHFITFFLIGVSFAIVYGLTYLQDKSNQNDWTANSLVKYGVSFLISGITSVLNSIFEKVLNTLTKAEKQKSMTNYYLSFSVKLAFFSFVTSSIVPLVSNLINDSNDDNKYGNLINNMFMMFLVNSFVTPAMWTLNVSYFIKKFQICIIESRKDPDKHHGMTQKDLNYIYELPDMNIAYKYSYLFKTLLMTVFFIPIFPIGVFITFLGLIFGYLLEKFNFTHLYKRPEMLNEDLCNFYFDYFIFILFAYGIADYIFLKETFDTKLWNLINIILFGVLIIIPYHQFIDCDCIGISESELNKKKFGEVYFSFYNDYERSNPMTKKRGLKNYLIRLYYSGSIDLQQYYALSQNIESINLLEVYYDMRKNYNLSKSQQSIANKNNTSIFARNKTNVKRFLGNKFFNRFDINNQNNSGNHNFNSENVNMGGYNSNWNPMNYNQPNQNYCSNNNQQNYNSQNINTGSMFNSINNNKNINNDNGAMFNSINNNYNNINNNSNFNDANRNNIFNNNLNMNFQNNMGVNLNLNSGNMNGPGMMPPPPPGMFTPGMFPPPPPGMFTPGMMPPPPPGMMPPPPQGMFTPGMMPQGQSGMTNYQNTQNNPPQNMNNMYTYSKNDAGISQINGNYNSIGRQTLSEQENIANQYQNPLFLNMGFGVMNSYNNFGMPGGFMNQNDDDDD